MRKLLLTLFSIVVPLTIVAQHTLHDIDINVELSDDGTAQIVEKRQMTIGDSGTESYIIVGNLKNSKIENLNVSDETGTQYVTEEGDWNVDRSREAKSNRCGIHDTGNGYELCWGLGKSGERTYYIRYTITNLVKAYTDADGFNFMFVASDIKPVPQHAKIVIRKPGTNINDSIADIWGFRHHGNINFVDSCIVDETTSELADGAAMIVLSRFNKGIFHPNDSISDSFNTVIDRAKEGSDYNTQEEEDDSWIAGLAAMGAAFAGLYGYRKYKRKKLRNNLLGDEKLLPWFRDTPVNGELLRANAIMKALYGGSGGSGNLMSAQILRLIYQGAVTITMVPYGRKNEPKKMLVIKEPGIDANTMHKSEDDRLRYSIHTLLYDAAGDDHILQPKELKHYIKENAMDLQDLVKLLDSSISGKFIQQKDAQQVVGMKKFLQEFTLTNERHVEEVSLWKEYLIFATLFGIGDQVRKDMAQMCPEYMEMDNVANAMMNGTEEGMLFNSLIVTSAATSHIVSQAVARANGSGGSTSFGGGGGFSGGGSGGGVR